MPVTGGAGGGLAGDPCTTETMCLAYRNCVQKTPVSEGVYAACERQTDCVCAGSRKCSCDDECSDGELCADPGNYCISPTTIDQSAWLTSIPCTGESAPPAPSISPIMGLTGDVCRKPENCLDPRICRAGGGDSCASGEILCDSDVQECSITDRLCYCYDKVECSCNDDCRDTEQCTNHSQGNMCASKRIIEESDWLKDIPCDTAGDGGGEPVVDVGVPSQPSTSPGSNAAGESPSPTDPPVEVVDFTPPVTSEEDPECIDASALGHMLAEELVFDVHVVKAVLCDDQGSCATDGHIVEYQGRAMMMKSYCELVGCEKRVMEVNSPRQRRRLRVPSRTEGLEFTAFAARYSTRAEEMILAAAIRIGL